MTTKTRRGKAPIGYDPSQFPAFAVTVDVVILTMSEGRLHVLLVCRGEAPFEGMWAIPGGFKRPAETLDEAARRELTEETGVDAASLLTQFGAYGDPERDPRMNVVTIAYLAVVHAWARSWRARTLQRPASSRWPKCWTERSTWRSTICGSCATPSSMFASSSRSRASQRRLSARRSPWPSCGPSTRRSRASSSTPRTSGGVLSPTRVGWYRQGDAPGPGLRAAGLPSSIELDGPGAAADPSIDSSEREERTQ